MCHEADANLCPCCLKQLQASKKTADMVTRPSSTLRLVASSSCLSIALSIYAFPVVGVQDTDTILREALADAGITPITAPEPDTPQLVSLGKMLFYDRILSGNKDISCATCHHPENGTGDAIPTSIGRGGYGRGIDRVGVGGLEEHIARNAPALFNLGLDGFDVLRWDGALRRNSTTGAIDVSGDQYLQPIHGEHPERPDIASQLTSALAAQVLRPIVYNREMRGFTRDNDIGRAGRPSYDGMWDAVMVRLVGSDNGTQGGVEGYRDLFAEAYPHISSYDDMNFGHAARAVAAYVTHAFTAIDTPFDRYLAGDNDALSPRQKTGLSVFMDKGRCARCHNGPLLTDFGFHALATPQVGSGETNNLIGDDRGLGAVTKDRRDNYKFRTPPLRNVALTAPWMHAGSYSRLEDTIRHHLNPEEASRNYDRSQVERQDYRRRVDQRRIRQQARIDAIDPILKSPILLDGDEFEALLEFVESGLTDVIDEQPPEQVPSGLPGTELTRADGASRPEVVSRPGGMMTALLIVFVTALVVFGTRVLRARMP
jgi:cytochrome c peroxidase